MIETKKRGNLIIISGVTSAGKGTIVKELLKRNDNLYLSISYTSREPRESEVDGVDYFFVSQEEFEKKISNNDFLEYAVVHYGCYYGTPKKEIEDKLNNGIDVILEIEVDGARQVKEKYPDAVRIFIVAPSMMEIKNRIKKRNEEDNEQIVKRLHRAYTEVKEIPNYDYVVVNDELEDAVNNVEAILMSKKLETKNVLSINVEDEEEVIKEFLD